jgi:hypothetical protein
MSDDDWDGSERRHYNGDRPRSSKASLYGAVATISILASGGVSTILYLNGLRNDLSVLQSQVVRDEVTLKELRDDQRGFSTDIRNALNQIAQQIADIKVTVAAKDGKR